LSEGSFEEKESKKMSPHNLKSKKGKKPITCNFVYTKKVFENMREAVDEGLKHTDKEFRNARQALERWKS